MKTVIEISAYKNSAARINVPKDWYECSVCGEWHPVESYSSEIKLEEMRKASYTGTRTRTNCETCYNSKDMNSVREIRNNFIKSNSKLIEKMKKDIFEESYFNSGFLADSITVAEMIEILNTLDPNTRITAEAYDTGNDEHPTSYNKPLLKCAKLAGEDIAVIWTM